MAFRQRTLGGFLDSKVETGEVLLGSDSLTLPEALAMQGLSHLFLEREQVFAYQVIALTGLAKGGGMTRTLRRFEEEFGILRTSREEGKRAAATHPGVPRRFWTPTKFGKNEVFSRYQPSQFK
ncbi:MAG TPA: hypothetical protein VLF88_03070 [Candidatus Babeliales bacterium]|nr:hypothetical protein [Candidatus Babeliales bacterium]